jgi:hypothetical protein
MKANGAMSMMDQAAQNELRQAINLEMENEMLKALVEGYERKADAEQRIIRAAAVVNALRAQQATLEEREHSRGQSKDSEQLPGQSRLVRPPAEKA